MYNLCRMSTFCTNKQTDELGKYCIFGITQWQSPFYLPRRFQTNTHTAIILVNTSPAHCCKYKKRLSLHSMSHLM